MDDVVLRNFGVSTRRFRENLEGRGASTTGSERTKLRFHVHVVGSDLADRFTGRHLRCSTCERQQVITDTSIGLLYIGANGIAGRAAGRARPLRLGRYPANQ